MIRPTQVCSRVVIFKKLLTIIFCNFLIALVSCNTKKDSAYQSPPGYDFNNPVVYTLPTVLDEISGVSYYPKDSSVFAIQDEAGWLFKIHFTSPLRVERWKFSTAGDYEDVARVDSTFYVLKSKGVIEKFKFLSGDTLSLQSFKVPQTAKNEFETLFYDSTAHQIILMCKNCQDDNKKQVTSWTFDPAKDSFSSTFTFETAPIRQQLGDDTKFKPSAAAIHPLTGEIYVMASVNHALVILNKDYSVKSIYKIDPALFNQPEGLTFTPKGDLIISNESGEKAGSTTHAKRLGKGDAADILFFRYNKPRKK
jgi:hypothetical protein